MTTESLFRSLLAAGRSGRFEDIASLPGAGTHAAVLRFADSLGGLRLAEFAGLPEPDRALFAKALSVYEDTVGGIGSVTALHRVLPLIPDDDHAVLDWILSNTTSYWYYAHGAKSFGELQAINAGHAARRALKEQRDAERERWAKVRKAEKATDNLFNAVRRGDPKAVQSLLRQGASTQGTTPAGVSLVQYAESLNRVEIAALLRNAQGGASAV